MEYNRETEFVEYKESTSEIKKALDSIAAMLNKHGKAKILFGYYDDGKVKGLQLGKRTILDITEEIRLKIKPAVTPIITPLIVDEKLILEVKVEGNNKPYSSNGNYLIRIGDSNRKMEPEELRELLFSSSTELITKIECLNQDLTFNKLKELYVINNYKIDSPNFLKNLNLYTFNNKYNQLAEMVADINNISVKVVRFQGYDKSKMIFLNEFGNQNILLAMKEAQNYVTSLNETRVILDGSFQRKEVKLFNEEAFKEAWSNAILHSKWNTMIPPAIYIFDDRLEIISTGGLPLDFDIEEFYEGVSHPINLSLQKIMGQLHIVEQTGHGVPTIISKYGKEAFDFKSSHITVTLKFPFEIKNYSLTDELNDKERKILELIENDKFITANEMSVSLSLSVPRIKQMLKKLKDLNYIERIGSNKNGYWKIK